MKPGKAKAGRRSAVQTLDKKIEKQKTKLAKAKEKYECDGKGCADGPPQAAGRA